MRGRLQDLGSVVSSPRYRSGAEPRPKTILVLSGDARMAVVAILVANFAFSPQILRLNHHQLGCRPSLSSPCLMLLYVRHSFEEI